MKVCHLILFISFQFYTLLSFVSLYSFNSIFIFFDCHLFLLYTLFYLSFFPPLLQSFLLLFLSSILPFFTMISFFPPVSYLLPSSPFLFSSLLFSVSLPHLQRRTQQGWFWVWCPSISVTQSSFPPSEK